MRTLKSMIPLGIAVIFCAIFAGCGKEIVVNHYPAFYDPNIQSIAVLPFEVTGPRKNLGVLAADHLAMGLTLNRTYKVLGPTQLEIVLEKQNIKLPSPVQANYKQVADDLGRVGNLQAFIAGQILGNTKVESSIPKRDISPDTPVIAAADFGDEDEDDEDEDDEGWGEGDDEGDDYDPDFYPYWYGPYEGYWYDNFYHYEYIAEALININASFVSIPDGKVLSSQAVEARGYVNRFEPVTARPAIRKALNKITHRLIRKFAVVPVKVKVHPGKDFLVAEKTENGQWRYGNTFNRADSSMYVVVCLPPVASGNVFKITITQQGLTSPVIAEQNIKWKRGETCSGYEFPIKQITSSTGPGNYTANFYSRHELVMTRNFKIR